MNNPWFRMYGEFSVDPKVQMMTEIDQRRLLMLLCARCNGNVTLQDEEVTFLLRISNNEWAITKANFVARGFIDNGNNLLNWDKRQFRSDSSKERVAKHRERLKQDCNVTVTPQNRTEQNRTEKKSKGTRFALSTIPDDWVEFCKGERPDLDPKKIFEIFTDHWKQATGKGATKLDWTAAWRNWIRSQYTQKKPILAKPAMANVATL